MSDVEYEIEVSQLRQCWRTLFYNFTQIINEINATKHHWHICICNQYLGENVWLFYDVLPYQIYHA